MTAWHRKELKKREKKNNGVGKEKRRNYLLAEPRK